MTADGKTKLKSPSGTLSTAEAISVVNSGLALAAHFGDGAPRRRPGRRPGRRGRQGPGAGPRRLAGIPGDGRQGARRLEGPLPRLPGVVNARMTMAPSRIDSGPRLRHPPPRPRLGPEPAAGAGDAAAGRRPGRGAARRRRAAPAAGPPGDEAAGRAPDLPARRPQRAVYYPFAAFSPEWQAIALRPAPAASRRGSWTCRRRTSSADGGRRRRSATGRPGTPASRRPRRPELSQRRVASGDRAPARRPARLAGRGRRLSRRRALVGAHGRAPPRRRRPLRGDPRGDGRAARGVPRAETTRARRRARPTCGRRSARRRPKASSGSPSSAAPGTRRRWPIALAGREGRRGPAEGSAEGQGRATWVPWTHGRLASASGYGAGIESPGWYRSSLDSRRTRWSSAG